MRTSRRVVVAGMITMALFLVANSSIGPRSLHTPILAAGRQGSGDLRGEDCQLPRPFQPGNTGERSIGGAEAT